MTLAQRAREATGLTQRDFAKLIGAHYSTVALWETGERPPSRLTASLLFLIEAHPKLCLRVLRKARAEDVSLLDDLADALRDTARGTKDVRGLSDSDLTHRKAGKKKVKRRAGKKAKRKAGKKAKRKRRR